MNFSEKMKEKARSMGKTIVLPEGQEERTLNAARTVLDEGIASKVYLTGKNDEVKTAAEKAGVDISGIDIAEPGNPELLSRFADEYYELRKHKGISREDAEAKIKEPLNWSSMMVRLGYADGMVAGAENSTANVLRAAMTIVKTKPGTKYASSAFIMAFDDSKWGVNGSMVFSDCATIPDPDSEQLAEIAVAASDTCKTFLEADPVTAMLSFSTKGSASHPNTEKVVEALKLAKEKRPDLLIDGEMQLDTAVIEKIGKKKAPDSKVAGHANVLVFPELQSGNIGYKMAERFAGAAAYGPVLQGFAKPVSDLSRGCSIDDIVTTVAMTLVQA